MEIAIVISLTVCFLALLAAKWFNPFVEEIIEKTPAYSMYDDGSYNHLPIRFDVTIKRTYKNGAVRIIQRKM